MRAVLVLLPEAERDIRKSFSWYESQSPGLGVEFLRCVEAAFMSIQHTPLAHPLVHKSCRRILVRRFPFAVFFELECENNRCVIHSVFHCSQDPEKWRDRLE